jgi:hypothetical protein
MATGSFLGVKWPGRGVDHPPPFSAEIKEGVELFLNYAKTQFMQFLTTNGSLNEINIQCNNKLISNTCNLKFLGIIIDNTLSWRNHTEKIAPKLSQACHAVRRTKPYLSPEALKMIYYTFFTQLCFTS